MKELPKYHETFIPILEILSDGKVVHINELRKLVRDNYYSDLPIEQLALNTKSGDPLILNRIGWGKAYLKQGKFLEQPERGMVRITEKGKQALLKGSLTLQELLIDSDFLAQRSVSKDQEIESIELNQSDSPQDRVDSGIRAIENQVKVDLLEKLKTINPYFFERVILELFQKMGYGDFKETKRSGDGGIDGVINRDELGMEKIYTQAKRYSENKVREPEIRNFIGAMSDGTTKGIFVTTSQFDDSAIKKARESRNTTIILIDGARLVDLMYKHGIGVQTKISYEVKGLDEDYFENE